MEKPIFDLLVEISKKEFIDISDDSKTTNRDKIILENERNRQLDYLLNQGFISNTKNIFIITGYGFIVAQYENWSEYLLHQKELMNKKIAKENNDLKISYVQAKTTYLPYYLSGISFLFSVFVFVYTLKKDNDENTNTKQDTELSNTLKPPLARASRSCP